MPSEIPDFDYIPLDNLRFDPENPRFPTSLDSSRTSEVLRFMLQDAGLIDLMRSIAKQGFFPGEPLLVSPEHDVADAWIVVEGNRRLAACMLLASPADAPIKKRLVDEVAHDTDPSRINEIPCLLFLSRKAILSHLGYRHVTGIKEWDPLAKARFLDQQFRAETGSDLQRLRSVARSIGSRADYVGRLLTAFHLYQALEQNGFFDIRDLSETNINFSLIPSVLAYANIVNYLGLETSQDLEMKDLDLGRWAFISRVIFEPDDKGRTRLGESRNIRSLADILESDRARSALESGATLTQAGQLLGGRGDVFRGLISTAELNLDLARSEMDGVRFGRHDIETLDRIGISSAALRDDVLAQIDGAD